MLPFVIPPLVWAGGAIATGIATTATALTLKYKKDKDAKQKLLETESKDNAPIILLLGLAEAGKDTIKEILLNAKFKESYKATVKSDIIDNLEPHKYGTKMESHKVLKIKTKFTIGKYFKVCNTGGADEQQTIIRDTVMGKKANELADRDIVIYCVYVFDIAKYLSNENIREQIKRDFKSMKKLGKFTLKIIGTHKDKAIGYDENLVNEIRKNYGECEIFDLTLAKKDGGKVRQELLDFIIWDKQ